MHLYMNTSRCNSGPQNAADCKQGRRLTHFSSCARYKTKHIWSSEVTSQLKNTKLLPGVVVGDDDDDGSCVNGKKK